MQQLEKNQFTHRYSKNTAIARQVGEWVNSFAEEHCGGKTLSSPLRVCLFLPQ